MIAAAPDAGIRLAVPAALTDRGFALRPESEADIPFLRRLYISTRWDELASVADWSEAQKLTFLDDQFALQRQYYQAHYAATEFDVIENNGVPAGRLYIDRRANMLIVHDIALLLEWRGRGTGTALMQAICAEARAANKKVSVAVEKFNPAQRLYQRLGFRETAEEGMHLIMEWGASPQASG